MYVDLGTGVRRSKDVPRITYVLKSALVPDLINRPSILNKHDDFKSPHNYTNQNEQVKEL